MIQPEAEPTRPADAAFAEMNATLQFVEVDEIRGISRRAGKREVKYAVSRTSLHKLSACKSCRARSTKSMSAAGSSLAHPFKRAMAGLACTAFSASDFLQAFYPIQSSNPSTKDGVGELFRKLFAQAERLVELQRRVASRLVRYLQH